MQYSLKRKKNLKTLRIVINADATVEVRAPFSLPIEKIDSFIGQKASWIKKHLEFFSRQVKTLNTLKVAQPTYEACKFRAKKLVCERLKIINQELGFNYNRVVIKNQRSKWGSCSCLKNLNFNYRILFLPLELADYLIAHELCHLREMNHSRSFYKLLRSIMPDFYSRQRELKKYACK
jgi:predicted metal-dependent hydrolase